MSRIIKPDESPSPEPNAELWTPETFEESQGIMEHAKTKANEIADKARDFKDNAEDKAECLYEEGKKKAQHAYEKSADAMHHVKDQAGEAAHAIRDYVKEQDLNHLVDEVSSVIRRHPLPAVLIGVGVGFLLAKTTRGQ